MITYIGQPKRFYFCAVCAHVLSVLMFYVGSFLIQWEPSTLLPQVIKWALMIFMGLLFGEFGRRFDLLIFSYSTHRWLWSNEPFPYLSKAVFWSIKLVLYCFLMAICGALLYFWGDLPILATGYLLLAAGTVFFGGFDFMVKGYVAFLSLRESGNWLSNLRFRGNLRAN